MKESDPYRHIRALAESIVHLERPTAAPAERPAAIPAVIPTVIPTAIPDPRREIDPGPGRQQRRGSGAELTAIATELRSARLRKGFTQRDLGRLAGVPQSHVSKIEAGAVDLRLSSLLALAAVLDLEMTLVASDTPRAAQAELETAGTTRATAQAGVRHEASAAGPDARQPKAAVAQ